MYRINFIWPLIILLASCVTVQEDETQMVKASKINVQLGIGYYHRGNLELANEKLLKALRQDPESSQAHHAYAVLKNHYRDLENAEKYFSKAIELDPQNSEALNNYGAFLCFLNRFDEADKMFMQAIENPLFRSPEIAFTSAAVCALKQGPEQQAKARKYLERALGIRNNYRPALINMASILLSQHDNKQASLYLERFHLTGEETARSLWLSIQNELEMGNNSEIDELAEKLENKFVESKEYQQWLALDK